VHTNVVAHSFIHKNEKEKRVKKTIDLHIVTKRKSGQRMMIGRGTVTKDVLYLYYTAIKPRGLEKHEGE